MKLVIEIFLSIIGLFAILFVSLTTLVLSLWFLAMLLDAMGMPLG
jgi:hypothetical protein